MIIYNDYNNNNKTYEPRRTPGMPQKSLLATTYEQNDIWATQTLAKTLWAGILLWRPGVTNNRSAPRGVCGHISKPW